jgi:pyruvyltransferase
MNSRESLRSKLGPARRFADLAVARLGHRSMIKSMVKAPHRMHDNILDDYEVADLIEVDGNVPLNYFTYRPNFGDLLSPWLIEQMTGRPAVVANRKKPHYVVIGSIISQSTDQSIIWGTGSYGTEGEEEVAKKARYTAVRGPLTRAKLSAARGFGIAVPEVYGDPALLLPLYYRPEVPVTHKYGMVVRWSERKWANSTYGPGVKLIDFSRSDVEAVVRELLSCRKIITSSLHGLVVADAYGIPNAWLASSSPRGGVFKYYDYFASVNKFRRPHKFDPSDQPVTVERLRKSFTFSGEPIEFDHRALLDAAPFLRRKTHPRSESPSSPSYRAATGLLVSGR